MTATGNIDPSLNLHRGRNLSSWRLNEMAGSKYIPRRPSISIAADRLDVRMVLSTFRTRLPLPCSKIRQLSNLRLRLAFSPFVSSAKESSFSN